MRLPSANPYLLAALLAAMVFSLVLTGCERGREHSANLFVFGTIVELKLWGASDDQANQAFAEIQDMFRAMHRDWHAWEPGLLVEVNAAFARGEAATADADISEMVRLSQWVEERSGGCFNPAIGALVALWGFHTSDYPIIGPPPDAADIAAILAQQPSTMDIRIDGLRLSSANRSVQLDFGGIAKGLAVDRAVEALGKRGIENAIVNAGGDLRAFGRHGERPWRVAIRKPGGGVIGAVEVQGDEALFTSGNYERFRQNDTERYAHILDPRTGWPVRDVAAATVIADRGALADAAATALIVAGLDDWVSVARSLGLSKVLMVDSDGRVYLTAEMDGRVLFLEDVERTIIDEAATPRS
jgi:thiamine biosynthesis lipoprotein